jgi:VanZ family protein
MYRILRSKILAITWFIIMCVLFFLPGSALPAEHGWMILIRIDKLVHMFLFAVLFLMCRFAFNFRQKFYTIWLFLSVVAYGLSVELIQKYWIPGRSFDLYDLLADTIGCIAGWLIYTYIKK